MPTRNVVITDHQQQLIESLVESGRYQNASEVLREGLRLIEEREINEAAKLQALRDAVQIGWDAYAAGDYIEINSEEDAAAFWAGIDADIKARVRPATKAG
jgi:antitoxin ParD1/3/4